MEFLKEQLQEKDLLIRTLIIRDNEVQIFGSTQPKHIPLEIPSSTSSDPSRDSVFETEESTNSNISGDICMLDSTHVIEAPVNLGNEEVDFAELHRQFIRDTEEEKLKSTANQLEQYKREQNEKIPVH